MYPRPARPSDLTLAVVSGFPGLGHYTGNSFRLRELNRPSQDCFSRMPVSWPRLCTAAFPAGVLTALPEDEVAPGLLCVAPRLFPDVPWLRAARCWNQACRPVEARKWKTAVRISRDRFHREGFYLFSFEVRFSATRCCAANMNEPFPSQLAALKRPVGIVSFTFGQTRFRRHEIVRTPALPQQEQTICPVLRTAPSSNSNWKAHERNYRQGGRYRQRSHWQGQTGHRWRSRFRQDEGRWRGARSEGRRSKGRRRRQERHEGGRRQDGRRTEEATLRS